MENYGLDGIYFNMSPITSYREKLPPRRNETYQFSTGSTLPSSFSQNFRFKDEEGIKSLDYGFNQMESYDYASQRNHNVKDDRIESNLNVLNYINFPPYLSYPTNIFERYGPPGDYDYERDKFMCFSISSPRSLVPKANYKSEYNKFSIDDEDDFQANFLRAFPVIKRCSSPLFIIKKHFKVVQNIRFSVKVPMPVYSINDFTSHTSDTDDTIVKKTLKAPKKISSIKLNASVKIKKKLVKKAVEAILNKKSIKKRYDQLLKKIKNRSFTPVLDKLASLVPDHKQVGFNLLIKHFRLLVVVDAQKERNYNKFDYTAKELFEWTLTQLQNPTGSDLVTDVQKEDYEEIWKSLGDADIISHFTDDCTDILELKYSDLIASFVVIEKRQQTLRNELIAEKFTQEELKKFDAMINDYYSYITPGKVNFDFIDHPLKNTKKRKSK